MFERLSDVSETAAATAKSGAEARLGRNIDLSFQTNVDIQLAVFAVSQSYGELLANAGIEPVASAGLSLGEYNHLIDIGALDTESSFDLVAARGRAYDQGPEGVMAAIQPLSAEDADTLVAALVTERQWPPEELAVSNDNSPTQCVVAGSVEAVEIFIDAASKEYFATGTVVERRIPMHTQRFAPAANAFSPALEAAPWRTPYRAYWPNVTASPLELAGSGAIKELLRRHVMERVLWRQTIDALDVLYPDAVFVEVGPRNVIANMICRRWIARSRVVSVDSAEAPKSLADIISDIGNARDLA